MSWHICVDSVFQMEDLSMWSLFSWHSLLSKQDNGVKDLKEQNKTIS